MSEESNATSQGASADEATVTFNVKASDAKYTLTLPLSTKAIDLKSKLSSPEYANVPAASQRLIYSGRVLKDEETLASYKVKNGNTMHLVKSAASNQRQNPASQSGSGTTAGSGSTPQASGVPQNIAAGTGNDPFAALTGARYAGFAQLPGAGMFGPDGGMGPPPSEELLSEMISNPQFAQMINEALQNPQVIDMMIQQNPQLRAMGPQARQLLQSDYFRQIITNPQAMQSMAQLSRAMGANPFGGPGQSAFPAPGVTNTTPAENRDNPNAPDSQGSQARQNPFASLLGNPGANPFAALLNPAFTNPPQQTGSNNSQTTSSPANNNPSQPNAQNPQQNPFSMLFNPGLTGQGGADSNTRSDPSQTLPPPPPFSNTFLQDPAAFNSMLQALGGGGGSNQNPDHHQNLLNLFGGAGASPGDNRPPEERYATQLGQLNEMGFFDFDRNIQALMRSGGDVNGALEWLFSQPS